MTSTDLRNVEHHANQSQPDSADVSAALAADADVAVTQVAEQSADASVELVDEHAVVRGPEAVIETAIVFQVPGELLRAAREKAGLSIADLSTQLRMAVRQIDALEKADYTHLPAGTFLRGFVRNYAKAVDVDPLQAIALLEKSLGSAAIAKTTTVVALSQGINIGANEFTTPKIQMAIGAGIALLLAAAAWYWWEFVRPNLADGGRPKSVSAAVLTVPVSSAPSTAALTDVTGAVNTANSVDNTANASSPHPKNVPNPSIGAPFEPVAAILAVAQTDPVKAPAAAVASAPVASVKKGRAILGFTFSGDSWVEVVDGTGKTVLSRHYKAGDADEVEGRAPFSIVVGQASVTRMAYNGKEFDLTPHTKLAVARVTVK